jgi:hypothetical protein
MLQNADITPGQWSDSAPVDRQPHGDDSLRSLLDPLQQLGFRVPTLFGRQNNVAGGVPMQLSVRHFRRPDTGAGNTIDTIRTLLRDHTPLTVSLKDLGTGDAAIDGLQRFCEFLQAEILKNNGNSEFVGVCIRSHQLPLQAFLEISKIVQGQGPRYVLLDDLQMTQQSKPRAQAETDKNWKVLWRNRMTPVPLIPAYGTTVRTACPLLSDEVTASVLPVSGIQVPVGSAWLPISLPLPHFSNDSGEISWNQLLPALQSGVDLADTIMDQLCWAAAGQRSDAHLNRRLALSVTGLGDLVARRGLDPGDLATLRWLAAIVVRIRSSLWQHSARLARDLGCLPALYDSDPSNGWDDIAHREDWRRRWQVALEQSAVRHRNMLILSPYSVLPSGSACSTGYTDLLPIVAAADAWSFSDVPQFSGWNQNEFMVFHRRAWAVIQGCKTASLVAAGV